MTKMLKTKDMIELLKIDWEEKYFDFVSRLTFEDKTLQKDFLSLLRCKDSKQRKILWENIRVNITDIREIWKLSNPYYIGFGNPESNILFLGKEKGFDIEKHPNLLIHESINNIVQWNYINTIESNKSHVDIFNYLGYNPQFPRLFHIQNISPRHTWSLYSQIVAGIYSLNRKEIFEEKTKYDKSFFNHCFISETNYIPSKYSRGNKLIPERKEFLKQPFFKNFTKIIIGAKGYLSLDEISDIFDISSESKQINLGKNKQRNIEAYILFNEKTKIVYCDQLSGASGWTNEAISNLINELL